MEKYPIFVLFKFTYFKTLLNAYMNCCHLVGNVLRFYDSKTPWF
jgi:hypothetical protein